MNERPTPETDAVRAYEGNWDTKALRMTAHARKLERERDEAMELVSELKRKISDYCDEQLRLVFENRRLHQERDEARSKLVSAKYWLTKERDDALSQICQAECRAERFCQERDEARNERDYFADQFKEAQNEIFRLHNVISKQHKLLSDKEMEESII